MKYIVLDIETDGLNPRQDALVSCAFYAQNKSLFLPVYHPKSDALPKQSLGKIQEIINNNDLLVGHNIKFDFQFLQHYNIKFYDKDVWDTGIAEYILSGQTVKFAKLSELIQKYSNNQTKIDLELGDVKASEYSLAVLEEYNVRDVQITETIFLKQYKEAKQKGLVNLIKIVSNFTKVLADMEYNGAKIDVDLLTDMDVKLKSEIEFIENKMKEICELDWINFNSSEQLSAVLFGGTIMVDGYSLRYKTLKSGELKMYKRKDKVPFVVTGLGFSTKHSEKTKDGYWSVSDSVIKQLKGRTKIQKEFIELYKRWRKLQTIQEKYTSKYLERLDNGFVYPQFNQTSTNTGRLSCNKPNIQQIPRPDEELQDYNIKDLFVSRYPNGVIFDVDFSQLEWRVCAYLCQDPVMIQEIKGGVDAHKQNASIAFNIPVEQVTKQQRQIAKMVSFGLIYGQTAYGLALRPDIPINSPDEAQAVIDAVYGKYKKLKEWHDRLYLQAMNTKKLVSPSGRWFGFINPANEVTKIKNYPVQSLATADIVPLVLHRAWLTIKMKGIKAVPINTVHDCIVYDCFSEIEAQQVAKLVKTYIFKAEILLDKYLGINFNVPLDSEAEIGKCWGKMKEIEVEI
jgi:DNA polymerase-1